MKRFLALVLASTPLLVTEPSLSAPAASASAPASAAKPAVSASAASASAAPVPSAAPSGSASVVVPLTPPPNLPAGHPPVAATEGAMGEEDPAMPNLPRDLSVPDSQLPNGTIVATIKDENDKPLPRTPLKLVVNRQSVAEGEKRETVDAMTDDKGEVRFDNQKVGSGWSYSVTVVATDPTDSAAFARYSSEPFMIPLNGGWRVTVHRYPVTSKIDKLLAAVEGVDTVIEVRDDVIEVTQMFEIVNAGTTTWSLGAGLNLTLPKGFKAVRAGETAGDFTAVGTDTGVRWAGSIPPGRSQLNYDYKLTYEGDPAVDLDIELPPRVLAARVRAAAQKGMELSVDGFPPAVQETLPSGVKILSTVKQGTAQDQLRNVRIHIKGLPTQGNDRWIVTAAALAAAAFGLWLSQREPAAVDRAATAAARKRLRKTLLGELVELERAHQAGKVGPKAYARERTKLLDAIADTLDPEPVPGPAGATSGA